MAIRKNIIDNQGFESQKLSSGFDELQIDAMQTKAPWYQVSSGSVSVTVSSPVTTIPMGVTATLPVLANHLLGKQYVLILTASGPIATKGYNSLLSGTNMINGGAWTAALSGSCNVVWIFSGKTAAGTFSWFAASGSALTSV